jgi:hypothetical protein
MDYLRWALQTAVREAEELHRFAKAVEGLVADMDEVVDGKGDGVVAIKRGRLEGVNDVVLLPFDHLSCTGEPEDAAVRNLQKEVLARLR